MKTAYFDCTSGISGDMFLGALVDAGLDIERLGEAVEALGIKGLKVEARKVKRLGFAATKVSVIAPGQEKHRTLADVVRIISASSLSHRVKATATRIFTRLATAEAKVHGEDIQKVHFHEVGALDSIADVVGAAAALELMEIESCVFSAIPVGSGTVKTAHGVLPVPAPATAELLLGVPLAESDETGELTTPTGAAIVGELGDRFGGMPAMTVEAIGCGAGTREGKRTPNILRVFTGELFPAATARDVVVIEAALDDITGEALAAALERILEAGAADAYATAIMMKKGRPGHLVTLIAAEEDEPAVLEALFRETSTIGARVTRTPRAILDREIRELPSPYGSFRAKVGRWRGKVTSAKPEFEDARKLAEDAGKPFKLVYAELMEIATRLIDRDT